MQPLKRKGRFLCTEIQISIGYVSKKKGRLLNNIYKAIMFLVLKKKREEKEDFTSTTFTNLQEEWDMQPESRQEPDYTWFCGINELREYIKDKNKLQEGFKKRLI